jgi:hypothetical protein
MPGAFPWVCAHGDVESYFCQTDYLAALYGVDAQTAEGWRSQAAANIAASKAKEKFFEKRRAVNWKIYRDEGGSPASETLWLEGGGASPRNQLGKTLYKALKSVLRASGHDDKLLNNFRIPSGFEMAPDLRWALERAIGAPLAAVLEEIS